MKVHCDFFYPITKLFNPDIICELEKKWLFSEKIAYKINVVILTHIQKEKKCLKNTFYRKSLLDYLHIDMTNERSNDQRKGYDMSVKKLIVI